MNNSQFFRQEQFKPQSKKTGICRMVALLLLFTVFLGFGYGFLQYKNYRSFINHVYAKNQDGKVFEVKNGETVDTITKNLIAQGYLPDKKVFGQPAHKVYLKLNPINSTQIQAGVYDIPQDIQVNQIYTLLKGSGCNEVEVTLKEGWRIEEIAEELEKNFIGKEKATFNKTEFISLAKNFTNPSELEFAKDLPKNLEGYLFPDTYRFCSDVTTQKVIDTMLKNFNTKVLIGLKTDLNNSKLSLGEIINVAAMVEREARGYEEKQMISDIILKRYRIGMPLGIDATSQYEFGYSQTQKTWWRKGAEIDQVINTEHRYSTRKNVGLPPTPIANPGVDAIKSVMNPTKNDYLFYITGNDGKMYYGRDENEHARNVCRYITMSCR
jgi:UPF0755 protein